MSGCRCHETVAAVCVGCGVRFTAGGLADRYCPRCRVSALAEACQGCGAEAGQECREWCLSWATDDTGQPVEVSPEPYGETPEEAALYLANGIRYLDEWAADIESQTGGDE